MHAAAGKPLSHSKSSKTEKTNDKEFGDAYIIESKRFTSFQNFKYHIANDNKKQESNDIINTLVSTSQTN